MHNERYSDFVLALSMSFHLGRLKYPKHLNHTSVASWSWRQKPPSDHLSACPKDMKLHRREEKEILSIGTTCMIIKATYPCCIPNGDCPNTLKIKDIFVRFL